jgi:hypothetical protein
MLVGCVSFDCHPGSPFFSHRRRMLLSLLCLLLPTPLALSPQKATPVPTTTLALSLSSEGHSLNLCAQMSPPACPICHRLSLLWKPALQQAGRTRVRDGERGQSGRRPCHPLHCRRGCDATSEPPPRLHSPHRKFSSRWKLIGPFYWNSSAVFLCDELCSFGVWNADGVCCTGLDV